ncbi:MAG: amidase [Opitutaceae bacterium]|jgi:amidase/aspartyl-tRNA(Asn)/glutamyl-tRNA(Gln) amidotransferase subunit A|nr:amidase [Opitutaceae bacterium]
MTPPSSAAQTIAEWQALAARDPDEAARELSRRLRTLLPPAQQAAAIASRATPRSLADAFARASAAARASVAAAAAASGASDDSGDADGNGDDNGNGNGRGRGDLEGRARTRAAQRVGVGDGDGGGDGNGASYDSGDADGVGNGNGNGGGDAPLAGAPYVLKDLFHARKHPLLAGSGFPAKILARAHAPSETAREVGIVRSLDEAGAVLAAKTHLHEFAYGITGENPFHGDCAHPGFPRRVSGGSSSGTAVAVASGLVPFGIGTDTGGSIRVPASFCGLYGMRLGAGHPWMREAFPLAPGFDTPGWLARTAADLLAINRALLAAPPAPPAPPAAPAAPSTPRKPRGCFLDLASLGLALDAATAKAMRDAARRLAPPADRTTRGQITSAFRGALESYSILQSTEAYEVHAGWLDRHRRHYSDTVWALIDRGRNWTPAQLDAAHIKRAAIRELFRAYFHGYDFLVMPATPFPALTKSDCTLENRNRLLTLNSPASLAGLPVLTLPVALGNGLSAGLQFIVPSTGSPAIRWALKTYPDGKA